MFNISSEYFIIAVIASIKSYYLHELLVTSHYFSKPTYLRISLYNLAIAVKQSYGFEVDSLAGAFLEILRNVILSFPI